MALKSAGIALFFLTLAASAQAPIKVRVDASGATQRLLNVSMTVPVKSGPFTLLYPKWIPGEHAPTGPIADLVGLKITGGGQTIPWRRDDMNMFAFHVDVPAGVTDLEVVFQLISPPDTPGFSSGSSITGNLAVISWNQLLLYPAGVPSDQLKFQASLKVPNGWRYGTALPIAHESGNDIEFEPSSLTTLIDSPVQAGRYFKTIELSPGEQPAHYLHIAADSEQALNITPEQEAAFKNLIKETGALYGSRHYRDYHFLLTLSDHVAHFGLEHHESSDDREAENSLTDDSGRKFAAGLLPHEFTHSWNGKYRRPAGLATGDYDKPMKGELLWVYEGLTEYLGEILTPRSKLSTPEQFRDELAIEAANLDQDTPGREWRPLVDTAVAAQVLYEARADYRNLRRTVDFYPEGTLIWLDVDTTIRRLSNGAKSIDDFCKIFHGGPSGQPALKPYTFQDVVATLNQVQPFDWAAFLDSRVNKVAMRAPLGGIENSGWKLTWATEPSPFWKITESIRKNVNLTYSIGLVVGTDDAAIADVRVGSPAYAAGLAPAQKVIAVNGRQFTPALLRQTIADSPKATQPIELLIRDGDDYKTFRIEYKGGEKYPVLERDAAKPDLLTQIIAPHAK